MLTNTRRGWCKSLPVADYSAGIAFYSIEEFILPATFRGMIAANRPATSPNFHPDRDTAVAFVGLLPDFFTTFYNLSQAAQYGRWELVAMKVGYNFVANVMLDIIKVRGLADSLRDKALLVK